MRRILVILLFLSSISFLTSVLMAEKSGLKAASLDRSLEKTSQIKKAGPADVDKESENPGQKTCDPAAYGLDCDILRYLEKNLTRAIKDGVVFCSYEELVDSGNGENRFLYAACQEFYLKNGKIYMGSGILTPVKLIVSNGVFSHWVPRDGSYFANDIKTIFPESLQEEAINYRNYEILQKINVLRAENYFNATIEYSVQESLDQTCVESIDCATPGKYQILSNCRYEARCIAGKCAVICPNYYFPGP